MEEHSCPEYGDQGGCTGRVTGRCNCERHCLENQMSCLEECEVGVGYRKCIDGKYEVIPINGNNKI